MGKDKGRIDKQSFGLEGQKLLRLSVPIIITGLSQVGMVFVDTLMMGRLGVVALASGSLGFISYVTVFLICFGLLSSVGVLAAYNIKAPEKVSHIVRHGLVLALGLGLLGTAVLWNIPQLLLILGQDTRVVEGATAYLHAIQWTMLLALPSIVIREFCSVLGRLRFVVIINVVAIPLNVLANYVFMYGKFGFPSLGLAGIGWATTLISVILFVFLAIYVSFRSPLRHYRILSQLPRLDPACLQDLFRLGWPVAIRSSMEIGLFTITALLMGVLGTAQLAAYQIAMQTIEVVAMVPIGIARATTLRVSFNIGNLSAIGARYSSYAGLIGGVVFSLLMALLFISAPLFIVSLYLDIGNDGNQQVLDMAVTFLSVASVFLLLDAVQMISNGALFGLKDTHQPMLLGLFSYWVIGLSSGYLLAFWFDMGGVGLWWGLALGLASAAILFSWRFHRSIERLMQA